MRARPIGILLATLAASGITAAGVSAASLVGNHVEDFTLRSQHGREWSLRDFSDRKLVVVAFLGTECPLVKLYGPRLAELHQRFESRGVAFIGINANRQDNMTEWAAYGRRFGLTFPLLKDTGNRVADAMGATRTPEVYLLDEQRRVRYHGRIDDQYLVGLSREQTTRSDLAVAIEELLAGQDVSVPETPVIGCHIGRVKQAKPTGEITYSDQIARIFNRRCVECHREGEIAPFPLTSYEDVIGWEDTILEVIGDNRMPPWFANPDHGKFENDARLSAEEKALISQWVNNGMPEGDPSRLPPAPQYSSGWRIPTPDQVFYMSDEPMDVPAEGVVDYQYFQVDPGWDEDKYIYASEARADNTSVVHHILVFVKPPGGRDEDLRNVLAGYAPGATPMRLGDGVAMRVPAGSKLIFQMHYTPNGYPQQDRSYAGVCFADKQDVTDLLQGHLAINEEFRIPPHADHHVVTARFRFRRDEMLLWMTPHMHLRGKSFRYEAEYPSGQREVLLDVPNYDFNWQLKYTLSEPKLMPRGTKMICTAVYDNSRRNLANPDPEETVRWGDQSFEEMMIGFFNTVPVRMDDQPDQSHQASTPARAGG